MRKLAMALTPGGDVLVRGETPQFGDDGAGAAVLERRGEPGDRGLAVGYAGVADPPRVAVAGGAVDDDGIAAAPALDTETADALRGGHDWLPVVASVRWSSSCEPMNSV